MSLHAPSFIVQSRSTCSTVQFGTVSARSKIKTEMCRCTHSASLLNEKFIDAALCDIPTTTTMSLRRLNQSAYTFRREFDDTEKTSNWFRGRKEETTTTRLNATKSISCLVFQKVHNVNTKGIETQTKAYTRIASLNILSWFSIRVMYVFNAKAIPEIAASFVQVFQP